jgi:ribosome maturation factor RimP
MNDNEQITNLLQPYLNSDQFYVVDCQVAGRRGGRIKVTILLDSDSGISIDECATISRQLGNDMEDHHLFDDAPFTLEVSSPGVDFPLTFARQYKRNIGRQLIVTLVSGEQHRGTLLSADDTGFVLDIIPEALSKTKQKKEAEAGIVRLSGPTPLPYEQVKKATVEIVFN